MMMVFNKRDGRMEMRPDVMSSQDDPNIRGAVKEAESAGKERGAAKTKAMVELDQMVNDVERYRQHAIELIGDPSKGIKPHEGFSGLVGFTWKPGMRYVEGSKEASAQARLDQIRAHAEKAAYVFLKGGGHITESERETIAKSLSRVSRATSEAELRSAINDHLQLLESKLVSQRRIISGAAFTNPNLGAPPIAAPAPKYDADKEKRYQEWKKKQGL